MEDQSNVECDGCQAPSSWYCRECWLEVVHDCADVERANETMTAEVERLLELSQRLTAERELLRERCQTLLAELGRSRDLTLDALAEVRS